MVTAAKPKQAMKIKDATEIVGGLSVPDKMPCHSWNINATHCNIGSRLRKVPGSVCYSCYALKGRYTMYKSGPLARERRLQKLSDPRWVEAMAVLIQRGSFFRWFDSGDIQGMSNLEKIIAVVKLTPGTQHWLPTREYGLIRRWFAMGRKFPKNLTVRVSAPMVDGDLVHVNGLPSSVVSKVRDYGKKAVRCAAGANQGRCGSCRACWDPKVKVIDYPIH